jgi:DnaJ-class molecular chaperone
MSQEEMGDLFGNEGPFSDFFRTFFGGATGARGTRAPRGRRGRDVEHDIELTLDEAFHGTTRRVSVTSGGHARSLEVRIPAGVHDGARVRAAGEGEAGSGGHVAGDLFLRVQIKPQDGIERRGDDLHVTVPVPVTTAVLGGEAEARTLGGPVRLRIPPMTQTGQVLRLKGHGMPIVGRGPARGDLYATVSVQIPARLTPEERAHYEALAGLASHQETRTRR